MFVYCVTVAKVNNNGQGTEFFQIEVPHEEKIIQLTQLENLESEMRGVILNQERVNFKREFKVVQTISSISEYKYMQQAMSQYKFIAFSLLREE